MAFGHYIKCQGLKDEWIVKQIVHDIQQLGKSYIILKTDGVPAIVAVQNAVQAMRKASTVPRNPPAYNPQSNGPCEKAVQDVTVQMVAIVVGLEASLGEILVEGSAVFQWALEHATFRLTPKIVAAAGEFVSTVVRFFAGTALPPVVFVIIPSVQKSKLTR